MGKFCVAEMIDLDEFFENSGDNEPYYYIDYLPFTAKDPAFVEVVHYLEDHHLDKFARRVQFILFGLLGKYEYREYYRDKLDVSACYVALGPASESCNFEAEGKPLAEVKDAITFIANDVATAINNVRWPFSLILQDHNVVVSVGWGFSVGFYNVNKEMAAVLEQLCTQCGLFLKYADGK